MDNKEYYEDNEIMEVPGFRFYPTEEELISFYLQQKLHGGRPDIDRVIPVVYIYDYNPWDLPKLSGDGCKSDPQLQEWFFFIPKHKKEAAGGRPNRLTGNGYWKATGSPGYVYSSTDNKMIGLKRTMVFYNGRARSRSGSKTDWKMNEYIAASSTNHIQKGDFTVCRVYKKSKCLRAFDRRPGAPPPIIGRPVLNHQLDHHDHQPSSSTDHHHQNLTSTVEIVRFITSESSSSSGDLSNNNNNNNNNNNILLLSQGYNNNNYEQPNVTVWDDCDWDWTMMNWNF